MMETASKPIHFFLDFNAVIVNLDKLPPESQQSCIASIEENIRNIKNLSGGKIFERKRMIRKSLVLVWQYCNSR